MAMTKASNTEKTCEVCGDLRDVASRLNLCRSCLRQWLVQANEKLQEAVKVDR
ncbi:Ribosomal protein S14p/S29e [Haladaptatus litoreus]|uniref:Ribosomal protein S14p/S29e n=1 Tax=Haladaptatus litoreus TaxID=553468 RepID=A0A1N7FHZ4_9EURY|nr:Ribosomal protein S14p/S29e [Haladaptatus litoreus]